MMQNIEKIKQQLILEEPFFGKLLLPLKIAFNNNIKSFKSRGDLLEINNEYLEVLNSDEIKTILANGALHQAFFHQERGKGKIQFLWYLASDFAINNILAQNGFVIPPLANYSSRFERLSTEEIYSILLSESNINEKEQEIQMIEDDEYNLLFEKIIQEASFEKELPTALELLIKKLKPTKTPWQQILQHIINQYVKLDYSLYPPNKRFLYQNITLPSIYTKKITIAIAIDTSASISNELLETFFSEINTILSKLRNYEIILIECDYKIRNIAKYKPMQKLKQSFKGGGGTDFRPVFDYITKSKEDIALLIYFTDAMGYFPQQKPKYPTIWALTHDIEVPFGKKILLN